MAMRLKCWKINQLRAGGEFVRSREKESPLCGKLLCTALPRDEKANVDERSSGLVMDLEWTEYVFELVYTGTKSEAKEMDNHQ